MALPSTLAKNPDLLLPIDSDRPVIRKVAEAIANLARQVMVQLDKAVCDNYGSDLAVNLPFDYQMGAALKIDRVELGEDDWVVRINPAKRDLPLPLCVQVRLPGYANMFVQFDFHRDATLALLAYQRPGGNVISLIRESLDNEEPNDFYGWISTAITIWHLALKVRPTYQVRKPLKLFDRITQKAVEFQTGEYVEITQDYLHIHSYCAVDGQRPQKNAKKKMAGFTSGNWLTLDPNDVNSSLPRAIENSTLVPCKSADLNALKEAFAPYRKQGHGGPADYLDSVFGKQDDGLAISSGSVYVSEQPTARTGKAKAPQISAGFPLGDPEG